MITQIHELIIRIKESNYIKTDIRIVQNDCKVHIFNIKVFDELTEIDYNIVGSATITFLKNDQNVVQGNLTKTANGYSYELGTNEVAYPGTTLASIQLMGTNGERLTTARVEFYVIMDLINPSLVKSTTEFAILQELKEELEAIDVVALTNQVTNISRTVSAMSDSMILTLTPGGTANAITLPVTMADKIPYRFKATADSTGTVTINGKAFKKLDGSAQTVKNNKIYTCYLDLSANAVFIIASAEGSATDIMVLAGQGYSNDADVGRIGTCAPKPINLLINSNYKNSSSWLNGGGATSSVENNVATVTGNGNSSFVSFYQRTNIPLVAGRKYHMKVEMTVTNSSCTALTVEFEGQTTAGTTLVAKIDSPVANTRYTVSGIVTATSQIGNINFITRHTYADAATANGKSCKIEKCMLVDVTDMFGAGKEPDKATIDAIIQAIGGWVDAPTTYYNISQGNIQIISGISALAGPNETSYVKKYEWVCKQSGTYRVSWGISSPNNGSQAQAYNAKNGTQVGATRITTSSTITIYTEDLSLVAGDKLQIYACCINSTGTCQISNGWIGIDIAFLNLV